MRLGILSDSHDQATAARHAMDALRRDRRASYIMHCGDLCSPRMLEFLAGEPAGFVFGNCDLDRAGLRRHAEAIGVHCFDEFGEFTMGGRDFAVIHGDDKGRLNALIAEQRHDYVLCGHTHEWRDEQVGRARVINPGALFDTEEITCGMLYLDHGRLEKIRL